MLLFLLATLDLWWPCPLFAAAGKLDSRKKDKLGISWSLLRSVSVPELFIEFCITLWFRIWFISGHYLIAYKSKPMHVHRPRVLTCTNLCALYRVVLTYDSYNDVDLLTLFLEVPKPTIFKLMYPSWAKYESEKKFTRITLALRSILLVQISHVHNYECLERSNFATM